LELGLAGIDDLVGEEVGVGDVGGHELIESVEVAGLVLLLLVRHDK